MIWYLPVAILLKYSETCNERLPNERSTCEGRPPSGSFVWYSLWKGTSNERPPLLKKHTLVAFRVVSRHMFHWTFSGSIATASVSVDCYDIWWSFCVVWPTNCFFFPKRCFIYKNYIELNQILSWFVWYWWIRSWYGLWKHIEAYCAECFRLVNEPIPFATCK